MARQAGVARGSVYSDFSSKKELFLTVMRRGTAEFVERSLRRDADSKPPLERLRSVAVHFLRAATETVSMEMYRTVVTQAERFPELSALFYTEGLQPIEPKFRTLLSLIPNELHDEPAFAADYLLSVLMGGFFSRKLLRAPKHPADKSVENYVDRAITSLLTRGRPRRHPSPGER